MSNHDLTAIVGRLQSRQDLSCDQMRQAIAWFLSGNAQDNHVIEFLVLLAGKGETVDELVGAAQALRESMIPIDCPRRPVVDTCGTGGDGAKTFNISTASALVVAAAGTAVAKHGNRKITSATGSADVLSELGINLEASASVVQRCLNEVGICFCFAPLFHPAMRHVGPARRAISHSTIFNRLGPLANPAAADRQILGVGAADLQEKMAHALQRLGTTRSLVVRGTDGVDEISLSAPTRVLEVTAEGIYAHQWCPADFGIQTASRDTLFADDPASSAACIRDLLSGTKGPQRDVVVLNAAAALWIADVSPDLKVCAEIACQAIDSGQAARTLANLGDASYA